MLTLPRCAVAYEDGPAYPMRSNLGEAAVLLRFTPQLPDGFHWCTEAEIAEMPEPHLRLDRYTLALLLFATNLDPSAANDHAVIAACHEQLAASHGTMRYACVVYGYELETAPEDASARMDACIARAARLLGTEA